MSIKNRLQKLEQQASGQKQAGDVFAVRVVNYRADIVTGFEAAKGAIPVKFVDYVQHNGGKDGLTP